MRAGLALLLLLLAPALTGCLGSGESLLVVANAPQLANGMNVAVAVPPGLFGPPSGTANFVVYYQGKPVYPPGGVVGAPLLLQEGKGSAFVPYKAFVVANGDYVVKVTFEDREARAQVAVAKWVNWVYALPYVRQGSLVIDLVLARTSGMPNDRVFAEGQLNVDVKYRGEDGKANQLRVAKTIVTDGSESFQRLSIPLNSFQPKDGYYSVEATFHNFQASGNNWVKMDPALNNANPPTNWVYIGQR